MELQRGQVAVVTGAGSGIGLALSERFASAGLNIVAADVQEDALESAATTIAAHGVEVHTVRCDVSKEEQVAALAQATLDRFGGVHVVCNNAGVAAQADPWFGPLSAWEWVMGVNFWGVVHGCRAFLPHLVAVIGCSLLPNSAGILVRVLAADGAALKLALHQAWCSARLALKGSVPPERRK